MTDKTSDVSSSKWSMEEREKILATGTLDEKREAFKDDEELMRETTKFVSEVIETATSEASKRKVHSKVKREQEFDSRYYTNLFIDRDRSLKTPFDVSGR